MILKRGWCESLSGDHLVGFVQWNSPFLMLGIWEVFLIACRSGNRYLYSKSNGFHTTVCGSLLCGHPVVESVLIFLVVFSCCFGFESEWTCSHRLTDRMR